MVDEVRKTSLILFGVYQAADFLKPNSDVNGLDNKSAITVLVKNSIISERFKKDN